MKKILTILLVASTSIWISGCSLFGSNQQNTQQPVDNTLTIWRVDEDEDIFKDMITQFEQEKGIKINFVKKDLKDYELDALDSLAAHKGPDIMMIRNDWMLKHYDKLIAMPENKSSKDKTTNVEKVKSMFPAIVTQDTIINNKVYGLPLSVDNLMLYINPRMVNKAIEEYNATLDKDHISLTIEDLPKTWEEIQKLIPYLTIKEGNKITQSGIALGTANNINRASDILYMLMLQNGVQMTSPDGLTATFNLPVNKEGIGSTNPGLETLKFFTSFADPSSPNYTWDSSMPDSLQAFMDGKVAMIIGYGSVNRYFTQNRPDFRFQTVRLPQISKLAEPVTLGNYWLESVTKSAKNPELAWSFVKLYTGQAFSNSYDNTNKIPKAYSSSLNKDDESPLTSQPLYAKSFIKGLKPEKFDSQILDMVNAVNKGDSPQKSLDNSANHITKILRGE